MTPTIPYPPETGEAAEAVRIGGTGMDSVLGHRQFHDAGIHATAPLPGPADMQELHHGIESALAEAMRRLRRSGGSNSTIADLCLDVAAFQKGGKRLRPILFLLAYEGYDGIPHPGLWRGAAAIELLHTFALTHDDIIDRSIERRGGPTLPIRMACRFAHDQGDGRPGSDLAILAGDVLFAFAMDTFLSLDFPADRVLRALRLIVGAAVRTGCGALEELTCRMRGNCLSRIQLLKLYDEKTGMYSFVCPLQAGAVLAGVDEDELAGLDRFGRYTGRAFQIEDDLDDLEALLDGSASPPTDESETLLLFPVQTAMRVLPTADGEELRRLCFSRKKASADVTRLHSLLMQANAVTDANRQIEISLARARQALDQLTMSCETKARLRDYCEGMFRSSARNFPVTCP